jgi:hypothetical protein
MLTHPQSEGVFGKRHNLWYGHTRTNATHRSMYSTSTLHHPDYVIINNSASSNLAQLAAGIETDPHWASTDWPTMYSHDQEV